MVVALGQQYNAGEKPTVMKKHTHTHVLPIVSVPYTLLIIIIRRASCVYYFLRNSILASLIKGVHLDWLNSRTTS